MTAEQAIAELRTHFADYRLNCHTLRQAARGLECLEAIETELNRRAAEERSERCPDER